jgi:hypothetical protein
VPYEDAEIVGDGPRPRFERGQRRNDPLFDTWLTAWKEIAIAHEAAVYCTPGAAPKQAVPADQVAQRDPGYRVIPQEGHALAIEMALTAYARRSASAPGQLPRWNAIGRV